ncbi:probable xanthan lyase [Sphingobium fuliginis]|uniref:Probable xanthan lyase n=2 Tax=Sphingobium fuliginis (strain ATCC 27551) TaxID=336203 RepID=A0A292ZL34_SPHSA|nr:probable xanthan lyase [Sphingobium fuliginis]
MRISPQWVSDHTEWIIAAAHEINLPLLGSIMDRRTFLAGGLAGTALAACQRDNEPRIVQSSRRPMVGRRTLRADVVVYGATPAGIVAAVSAAQMGASAIIVGGWRERQPGGMLSGGLSWTDYRDIDAFGGLARAVIERLAAAGGMPRNRYAFDPALAVPLFERMTTSAGVPMVWSDGVEDVKLVDRRISEFFLQSGRIVRGRMFIDASYEGDLMARAGVAFKVGREAADAANPLNGYRGAKNGHLVRGGRPDEDSIAPISPFWNGEGGALLPHVAAAPDLPLGAADKAVQAYCFRLTMTNRPDLRQDLPARAPDGYDESRYELLFRDLDARRRKGRIYGRDWTFARDLVKADEVAPGIYDVNNRALMSIDAVGLSHDYPQADYATREKIWKAHEAYLRGWFHAMAYGRDPRIPPGLQREVREWGLVRGRHIHPHPNDLPGWSPQLYVREARRLDNGLNWSGRDLSDVDGAEPRRKGIVAMGSYWQDSHSTRRIAVQDGAGRWGICNEGSIMLRTGGKYERSPLPIDLMLPHRDQCTNLIVPFCVAATHQAFATIRMELTSMALGEAAGRAAAMALGEDNVRDVQDVPMPELQAALVANKGVIHGVSAFEDYRRRLKFRLNRMLRG